MTTFQKLILAGFAVFTWFLFFYDNHRGDWTPVIMAEIGGAIVAAILFVLTAKKKPPSPPSASP